VLIFALIGLSLVVLTGWAGQISLGQFAFTGVGAAVAGGFATKAGGDFFLALLLAGLAGAAFAVVVGLPAVRVQGLFLAVTTLAFASACYAYLLNRDYFGWLLPETGDVVERPKLYGLIDVSSDRAYYYVCAATLGLAVLSVRSLRKSRAGRALCATRDNPKAAQAFGLSLARVRLMAFAVSGFLAAVAGGLYSYLTRSTDPENFFPTRSIDVFAMAVIGGLGSIPGAIAGAVYVVGVKEFLPDYELLASGAGMLLLLLVAPGGLAELGYRARDRFVRLSAGRHGMTDRDLAWGPSDVKPTAADTKDHAADEPAVGLEEAELPALTGRGSL
jgi:branched-chain amino acid transport system permease protein